MSRGVLKFSLPGRGCIAGILLTDASQQQINSYVSQRGIEKIKKEIDWFYGTLYENGVPYRAEFNYRPPNTPLKPSVVIFYADSAAVGAEEAVGRLMEDFLTVVESREVDDPELLERVKQIYRGRFRELAATFRDAYGV